MKIIDGYLADDEGKCKMCSFVEGKRCNVSCLHFNLIPYITLERDVKTEHNWFGFKFHTYDWGWITDETKLEVTLNCGAEPISLIVDRDMDGEPK